jgi:hypothetical protein
MDTGVLIILLVVLLVVALLVVLAGRRRRSGQLRERYGDEYERTVDDRGSRREAESELAERERRRERLDIRPLDPGARERYGEQWRRTQADFVDSPHVAVRQADVLVLQVMRDRGYPVDDFEQRAADISVDHPEVVSDYRAAHHITNVDGGEASTEQLREAMVHYRSLFERLLADGGSSATR